MPVVWMVIPGCVSFPFRRITTQRIAWLTQHGPIGQFLFEVQRCGRSKRMAAASTAILGRNRDNVHTTFSEPLVGRIALGDNLK